MTNETEDNRPKTVWQSIEKMTELLAKDGISKDKGGSGDIKYKFRGIDDIRNHISPLQKECALIILPRIVSRQETERTTKSGGFALWVNLTVHFDLLNTIDGSKYTVRFEGEAVDYSDKATQKAMSQAYKVFAINTFNIPTEGEQDGDNEKIEISSSNQGIFRNLEELNQYVENCVSAFNSTKTEQELRDIETLYHDKLVLLRNSQTKEDKEAGAKIANIYHEKLQQLKDKKVKL
jgi:hypothetical protein